MNDMRGQNREAKMGKRNRPPTSCEPCRIRKLKCNRGSPCDTCVKRNKQMSCEYADNANRNQPKRTTGDRLENLEKMVLQFVRNGDPEKPQGQRNDDPARMFDGPRAAVKTDVTAPKEARGTLHVQEGQVNYVDSSNWLSILHDIKEVREELTLSKSQAREEEQIGMNNAQPEVDLIFGALQTPSLSEILQSLPSKTVCDSLISFYFNFPYIVLPILHPLKFQKEYERFWEDSSKTPTLWIGLLFSILGIANTLRQITNASFNFQDQNLSSETFKFRTTQCLVLGHYATAKAYGLETLFLNLLSNFLSQESDINNWFGMGIIIRLAMRMGYHRDSRHHPSISPFEDEMRRRMWAGIYQIDILISFQLGLPSMIPTDYCDAKLPRNLNFSDFAPNTTIMPPSRPLSDHTPILYTIAKGKVMDVFKKIVAHTQSLSPPPLETTIMLDIEMRDAYNNVPTDMKMRSVGRSFMDASATIMKRCSIELLHLKGIIVLHRRFLNRDSSDSKYGAQRRACIDASMEILARQADLHQACQPGGQLCADQWMLSSLMVYDFLLAAMVVCLQLSEHMRNSTADRNEDFVKQFEALKTSHAIWSAKHVPLKDARTAAQVLELMIRTVENGHIESSTKSTLPFEDFGFPYAEPVTEMIDGSENLDWALIDQYFQNNDGLQDFSFPPDGNEQGGDPYGNLGPDWLG